MFLECYFIKGGFFYKVNNLLVNLIGDGWFYIKWDVVDFLEIGK